jgi:Spy/CpxP family protein refolding chaperone
MPTLYNLNAAPAASENAPAPGNGPQARQKLFRQMLRGRIAHALHLTPEQQEQMRTIRGQTAAALKGIRADTTLTADQRRQKAFETMQGARKQIHGVLTAEQEVKLHKIQRHLRKLRSLLAD